MGSLPPLFLCTHADVGLSVLFRCFGEKSKVFQVYPSFYESRLEGIPGVTVCCVDKDECCSNNPRNSTATSSKSEERTSASKTSWDGSIHRSIWGSSEFYSSPHFWTALVVLLLVCFMIFQNAYSYRRARRVLPMLERETEGPYLSTRESGGIILPKVVYSNTNKQEKEKKKKNSPKQKRANTEILNAGDLMALELELNKDKSGEKILSDDEPARVYITGNTNSRNHKKLKIQLFDPATPAFENLSLNPSSSAGELAPGASGSSPRLSRVDSDPSDPSSESQMEPVTDGESSDHSAVHNFMYEPLNLPNQIQETCIAIPDPEPVSNVHSDPNRISVHVNMNSRNSSPNRHITSWSHSSGLDQNIFVLPDPILNGTASTRRAVSKASSVSRRRFSLDHSSSTIGPLLPPGAMGSESEASGASGAPGVSGLGSYDNQSISVPTLNIEDPFSVSLPLPLKPAYHPSRRVSGVWRDENSMERLYRYTNMDRLVYPPGYIT